MTDGPITLDELLQTREELIAGIVGDLPEPHRRFLLSAKGGGPDWPLLALPGAELLPAVRWRLENLAKLDAAKRSAMVRRRHELLRFSDA